MSEQSWWLDLPTAILCLLRFSTSKMEPLELFTKNLYRHLLIPVALHRGSWPSRETMEAGSSYTTWMKDGTHAHRYAHLLFLISRPSVVVSDWDSAQIS